MKKKVEVIITKEIEIEIDDSCLTPEYIAAFEETMFSLDDMQESKVDGLFAHAAHQVSQYGEQVFVEGVGQGIHWSSKEPFILRCKETSCDVEVSFPFPNS